MSTTQLAEAVSIAPPARQLRAWRALHDVTQATLAKRLRVPQITVSRIEAEAIQPEPKLAVRIAKVTGIEFPS